MLALESIGVVFSESRYQYQLLPFTNSEPATIDKVVLLPKHTVSRLVDSSHESSGKQSPLVGTGLEPSLAVDQDVPEAAGSVELSE